MITNRFGILFLVVAEGASNTCKFAICFQRIRRQRIADGDDFPDFPLDFDFSLDISFAEIGEGWRQQVRQR